MSGIVDVENGSALDSKQAQMSSTSKVRLNTELTEVAGIFFAWSILALVEGAIRVVRNAHPGPTGDLTPPEGFPPLALLLAGLAEVVFGSVGILLALAILVFKLRNPMVVTAFLIGQSILGWFVFITFVLAEPFYALSNLEEGGFGFSRGLHRFLIFLGIVTSIAWCAALQSGQFVLASRCRVLMKGRAETMKMHKLRGAVWAGFAALAGLAMLLNGALVNGNIDGSAPFLPPASLTAFPPHVNIYPVSILIAGIINLVWGILGVIAAVTVSFGLLRIFNLTWFPVFFANIIVFALMLGRVPDGGLAFAAAQHVVLSIAFTLLPVLFTRKIIESSGKDDMSDE